MSTARKNSVAKKRFYANWDLSKALRNPHQHPSQYMTGTAGRLLTGAPKRRNWRDRHQWWVHPAGRDRV